MVSKIQNIPNLSLRTTRTPQAAPIDNNQQMIQHLLQRSMQPNRPIHRQSISTVFKPRQEQERVLR